MNAPDCWAEWLATRRFGGDADVERDATARLGKLRDAVLARAALTGTERILDVGCGEGLIGFGALESGAARVVFSDVSESLLDACRKTADALGVADRCSFVLAAADDLSPIASGSVDVVTTRSVLIYVDDKRAAFEEFFRVLRPGGRISLYEPINRFAASEPGRFAGYDLTPLAAVAAKLKAVYDAIQPRDSDPMLDFDERDLVRNCETAGFHPIDLDLHVEIRPTAPQRWDAFVNTAGNPRIPTLAEAMDECLDPDERAALTELLRPEVEAGNGVWRMAHALLAAVKPPRQTLKRMLRTSPSRTT
jgi:ubiquinone/menaquinone biosynthesis C-methylase UbiE